MTLGLLQMAAMHPCAYDGQGPPCAEEWEGEPWKWCGACLSREWFARAAQGDLVEVEIPGPKGGA